MPFTFGSVPVPVPVPVVGGGGVGTVPVGKVKASTSVANNKNVSAVRQDERILKRMRRPLVVFDYRSKNYRH